MSGLRILLVEDVPDVAFGMAVVLRHWGHRVTVAPNGPEAIRATHAGNKPDVVLLDIGLPGMSGYDVAKRLRNDPPTPLLIAVTGFGQDADRQRSREAGIDLHFVKPVDLHELQTVLLDRQRTAVPA